MTGTQSRLHPEEKMIVLMDLEWVTNAAQRTWPTQLAAMRVDNAWNPISTFHSLCRPLNASFQQWDHVAYAGAEPQDFLHAPPAEEVFRLFRRWLNPDDVLLWWNVEAPMQFTQMMAAMCFPKLKNKKQQAKYAFQAFVNDGYPTQGGLYHLADVRQIPLLQPEHCAVNDVCMLQRLLQKVGFRVEYLHRQIPGKNGVAPPPPPPDESAFHFLIVIDAAVVHKRDCSLLPDHAATIACKNLAECTKYRVRPCTACCRQEWTEYIVQRNADTMKRSKCSFFFLPTGRVFHRAGCHTVLHSRVHPKGVVRYETCLKSGRAPCRICNPAPPDAPASVSSSPEKKESSKQRRLSATEKRALKRFRQASQERAQLNTSAMTAQEKTDAYTLTTTSYAFWAAPGYDSFHMRNCVKLNGLRGLRGFPRFSDAVHAGFKPCRQCRPSARQDAVLSVPIHNQERQSENAADIIARCQSHGYACTLKGDSLTIETPVARWIVDVTRRPVFVMHQHTGPAQTSGGLHRQPRIFLSLSDLVSYIMRHDAPKKPDDKD